MESLGTAQRLEIQWSWQRKLHIQAQRAMWNRRKRAPRREWMFRLLLAVAGIVIGYAMFETLFGAVMFTVSVGLMGTIGGVVGQRVQWYVQARQFEKCCLPKYESVLYIIDSTGVRIRNADTDLHQGWSTFERWSDADEFVLLFTAPAVGYYIPKASLTAEMLSILRDILDSRLAR